MTTNETRDQLVAGAQAEAERYKLGLQAICNGARFDPAEVKRRAFVDGVKWAADTFAASASAPVDEAKLAEVIDDAQRRWNGSGRREPIATAITREVVALLRGEHGISQD